MAPILTITGRKVIVSRMGVALFNARWPCSELCDRSYWFEFDDRRDLVDTDVPEQDDGPAAVALMEDCRAYLFDEQQPEWLPLLTLRPALLR